eukprot:4698061-Prymnesium_polylepis.1
MMLATTARHEVLAPYLEFDTSATAENQGVDALWVKELPKPVGFFGNAESSGTQISRPACEVTPKGGSGKGSFTSWIDKIVEPVYDITPTPSSTASPSTTRTSTRSTASRMTSTRLTTCHIAESPRASNGAR